jgi:hypothetical protein
MPMLRAALCLCFVGLCTSETLAQQAPAVPPAAGRQAAGAAAPSTPFDPANYVRIFEETSNERIELYAPSGIATRPTLLRADLDSKIVIQLEGLNADMALNGLFMSAEMSRSNVNAGPVKVEVLNYSEVATDPATQASQAGVALRTASEVYVIMRNLFELTRDLVAIAYEPACSGPPLNRAERPKGCSYARKTTAAGTPVTDMERDGEVRRYLRAFQPRVDAIADFFTSDRNALVLTAVGDTVFDLDARSLRATAAQIKQDVAVFIGAGALAADARDDLLLHLQKLWDDMQPLRTATSEDPKFFDRQWSEIVFPRYQRILAPGTIDLRKYRAADGDTLTLTIQARSAGGQGTGGISRDFQIAIRKLRTRVTTEPTAFYLRRAGTIRNAMGQVIPSNFAPAPGVTFGPVFYTRRQSFWAPGIGVNVSFMNFAANDFDPTIKDAENTVVGGFRDTTSTSIQVGIGYSLSMFSNAIQFTQGWNLNVDKNRMYYGIGLGFLQVGEEIAKFVKK